MQCNYAIPIKLPIMPNQFKINHLTELQGYIGKQFIDSLAMQAQLGDPDWFYDICNQLDYINESHTDFIQEFHFPLLRNNIKREDINQEQIMEQMLALPFTQAQLDEYNNPAEHMGLNED